MKFKRLLWLVILTFLATSLAGCNLGRAPEPTPDVNALYTAAAETMIAQLGSQQTQTALAVSPTPLLSPTPLVSPTPLPTFPAGLIPFGTQNPLGTPFTLGTPGIGQTPLIPTVAGPVTNGFAVGCNNAVFIGETIPDGTKMEPNEEFKKGWSLLNTGTCTWDENYEFAFKSGERLSGNNVKISFEKQFTKPNHSQAFIVQMAAPKAKGEYTGFWQMRADDGTWFGSLVYVKIVVQ